MEKGKQFTAVGLASGTNTGLSRPEEVAAALLPLHAVTALGMNAGQDTHCMGHGKSVTCVFHVITTQQENHPVLPAQQLQTHPLTSPCICTAANDSLNFTTL